MDNENIEDLFSSNTFQENLNWSVSSSKEIIKESDLKLFFRCPYAYFLKRHSDLTKIRRSAFGSQVIFFNRARTRLFNLRSPNVGKIFPFQHRAGPEMKLAEEMTSDELRTYLANKSPTTFGNSLYGAWLKISRSDFYADSEILWNFEGQDFKGATTLRSAGRNYYNFNLENGAPIFGFLNEDVSFEFEGNTYTSRVPELRKILSPDSDRALYIDDPTIWSFNLDIPLRNFGTNTEIRSEFSNSALVTLRVLGICRSAYGTSDLRSKWGIPNEVAEKWDGNSIFLDDFVRYRHFNASKNHVSVTTRKNSDLDLLRRTVDHFLLSKERKLFPPRERFCRLCQYNILDQQGEVVCHKRKKGQKPAVPSYYFRKRNFEIEVDENIDKIVLSGIVRKNEGVTKNVAKYELAFIVKPSTIQVTSSYHSEVRGLGFEEIIVREADRKLQELADKEKKVVVHQINFEDDFKYAGQRRISEVLGTLKYFEMEFLGTYRKEYQPKEIEKGRPLQVGLAFES